MLTELLFRVGYKSIAWVCDIYGIFSFIVLFYLIDNNKMVLIPMSNARQWYFMNKCIKTQTSSNSLEADGFCCFADTKKRHSVFA